MKKSQISKKFWLILLALIGTGLFIYFIWLPQAEIPEEEIEPPEEVKADKIPPSTAIVSPPNKSWHNADFEVLIYDSDLGSGLIEFVPGEKGCRYIIEDLGTGQAIGDFRKCDPIEIFVPVGEEKTCSSSYQKENPSQGKCLVSTKAFDWAGNESGWKSRVFNIDLIKPKVGQISSRVSKPEETQVYLTSISDNSKIIGCWFYVNGKATKAKVRIEPIPCKDNNECIVSANYSFDSEGDYSLRFGCQDMAGNLGFGNSQIVKVITNHPPEISSCKVNPTQGTIQTEFQFKVIATDLDGDTISYSWDFGDGKSSEEKNPTHYYLSAGTYEPKIIVSDGRGGEAECSTAWVTIIEE